MNTTTTTTELPGAFTVLYRDVEEGEYYTGIYFRMHELHTADPFRCHAEDAVEQSDVNIETLRTDQGLLLRALNEDGHTDLARAAAASHMESWVELSQLATLCGLPETTIATIEHHRVSAESTLNGLTL